MRKMKPQADRELPPAGNHPAYCCGVALTGWQDGLYGLKEEILISWELPTILMVDGKPFVRTAFLPFNLGLVHKGTKLAKIIWGWFPHWTDAQRVQARASIEKDPTSFFKWLLGKACFLSLIEKGDNVLIDSLAAWPPGVPQKLPAPVTEPWYFDCENPADNIGNPPQWILERARKAKHPDDRPTPVQKVHTEDFPYNTPAGGNGQLARKPGEDFLPVPGVDFPLPSTLDEGEERCGTDEIGFTEPC